MGWANASYLQAVLETINGRIVHGRNAANSFDQTEELSDEAIEALRLYSRSEFAGQVDGKTLNAALLAEDRSHDEWAENLDRAFVWTSDRDVLLWRGFKESVPVRDASRSFLSTSLVERQARRFKSRGGSGVAAIVLPAGSRVAIPQNIWSNGDERTLGIVRREAEIILPRETSFELSATVFPFRDREGSASARVSVYRASVPTLDMAKLLTRSI